MIGLSIPYFRGEDLSTIAIVLTVKAELSSSYARYSCVADTPEALR